MQLAALLARSPAQARNLVDDFFKKVRAFWEGAASLKHQVVPARRWCARRQSSPAHRAAPLVARPQSALPALRRQGSAWGCPFGAKYADGEGLAGREACGGGAVGGQPTNNKAHQGGCKWGPPHAELLPPPLAPPYPVHRRLLLPQGRHGCRRQQQAHPHLLLLPEEPARQGGWARWHAAARAARPLRLAGGGGAGGPPAGPAASAPCSCLPPTPPQGATAYMYAQGIINYYW